MRKEDEGLSKFVSVRARKNVGLKRYVHRIQMSGHVWLVLMQSLLLLLLPSPHTCNCPLKKEENKIRKSGFCLFLIR